MRPGRPSIDCSWVWKILPTPVAEVSIAKLGSMSFKVRRSRTAMTMLDSYLRVKRRSVVEV
jgi:hypothetical protein